MVARRQVTYHGVTSHCCEVLNGFALRFVQRRKLSPAIGIRKAAILDSARGPHSTVGRYVYFNHSLPMLL